MSNENKDANNLGDKIMMEGIKESDVEGINFKSLDDTSMNMVEETP